MSDELVSRLDALEAKATKGEWFAWCRTPQHEGDAGGLDISIQTADDSWVIAEFSPFGLHAEAFQNADNERQLAIALRNSWSALRSRLEAAAAMEEALELVAFNAKASNGFVHHDDVARCRAALAEYREATR